MILSQHDLTKWVNDFLISNGCKCKKCHQNKLLSDNEALMSFQEHLRDLSDEFRENLLIFFVYQSVVNAENWSLLCNCSASRQQVKIIYRIEPFGIVCRGVFRKLLSLSDKKLRNLLAHVKSDKFPTERFHGSTGKSHNHLTLSTSQAIEKWLLKLANHLGEPKWKDIHTKKDLEYIMLPACYSISLLTSICRKDLKGMTFSRSAFYRILTNDACKHIKIRSSRTDMCSTCERIKIELRSLYQKRSMGLIDDIPELISDEFNQHLRSAREARMDYRADQKKAREGLISHFSFDFAQNLTLPQCADQPGELYFRSLRNIYLFGVVDESKNRQANYLIDEADMSKGANEVISLLWHYLQKNQEFIKSKLVLNADNTVGQNKNNALMRFLAWLCATKFITEIEIKFMVVGHTHFLVDANFGHIKRHYQRSNAYTIGHLSDIIKASSQSNDAFHLNHQKIFDFTAFLSQYFIKIPKISSKYYFKFKSKTPWVVQTKSNLNDEWNDFSLIKKNVSIAQVVHPIESLKSLPFIGISSEKKVDFYDKVRAFVPNEFRESLCPKPSEEERVNVKNIKAKKRKTKS